MKFLKSLIPLVLLVGYLPAQALEETASDPESINLPRDRFQNNNEIQEEQEQLRMEKEEQQFDAFGVDEFDKNDYPSDHDDQEEN